MRDDFLERMHTRHYLLRAVFLGLPMGVLMFALSNRGFDASCILIPTGLVALSIVCFLLDRSFGSRTQDRERGLRLAHSLRWITYSTFVLTFLLVLCFARGEGIAGPAFLAGLLSACVFLVLGSVKTGVFPLPFYYRTPYVDRRSRPFTFWSFLAIPILFVATILALVLIVN